MSYIVKLSHGVKDKDNPFGGTIDGEYHGGMSIEAARKEAQVFADKTIGGSISIVTPIREGMALKHVCDVRRLRYGAE